MLSQEIVLSMATRETADVSDKPKSTSNPITPPSTKPRPPGMGTVHNKAAATVEKTIIFKGISIFMASATK